MNDEPGDFELFGGRFDVELGFPMELDIVEQRCPEAHSPLRIPRIDQVIQRHAEIVVLNFKAVEPLGMISQLVDPPENLRAEAQSLAEHIASTPQDVLRATKQALWRALESEEQHQ